VSQEIPMGCGYPGIAHVHRASHGEHDCGTLEIGLDAYYKIANDLIDNGNFGQALVLSKSQDPLWDFRSGRWFGA